MSNLVERLRKLERSSPESFWDTWKELRNPDGPEAADAIERLQAKEQTLLAVIRGEQGIILEDGYTLNVSDLIDKANDAFESGWRVAADWANRDDLLHDIGSLAYIKNRDAALKGEAW